MRELASNTGAESRLKYLRKTPKLKCCVVRLSWMTQPQPFASILALKTMIIQYPSTPIMIHTSSRKDCNRLLGIKNQMHHSLSKSHSTQQGNNSFPHHGRSRAPLIIGPLVMNQRTSKYVHDSEISFLFTT